jgi:hypothetical protein
MTKLKNWWVGAKQQSLTHSDYLFIRMMFFILHFVNLLYLSQIYIGKEVPVLSNHSLYVVYHGVWCLDNWFRILSGKPFNTFSMARLKTLQLHLTLTPLFTATHTLLFLSFRFILVWTSIYGSYWYTVIKWQARH